MKKLLAILLLVSFQCFGQYPIKNMLGVNVHEWDIIAHPQQSGSDTITTALQKAITSTGFSWIRLYSDATVIKDATNQTFMFSPNGRGYEIDKGLASLKAANVKVNYCYQNAPKNIQSEWTVPSTQYRSPDGYNWDDLSNDMAVITARGGSNTNVSDYPVYVSPNWWESKQQMLKGAKLYDQVEPGNEYDNNWSNAQPLNASQYVALWRSVYNKVKSIDPSMSVSTTGVMTGDAQMLTDIIKASGGSIPFDKYQFHLYPWGWKMNIASALPPELSMIPDAKKVIAASNGIPCIVGEWGYDLHPLSDIGIRPFSNYTAEEIRSYWIERSILGFVATGIESAFYYRIYQDYGLANDNNPVTFQTSSLFIKDDQNNITRRLSGDVFYNLSKYGDYVFDKALVETDSLVVYRFKNGVNYLYTGWTVEKVQLVTINGVNRAAFTERKINYTFPDGQTKLLSSKPVEIITSASLPVRDKPQPKPKPHQKYTVEVQDIFGNTLMIRKDVEIEVFRAELKRSYLANGFYILKYVNGKEVIHEKFIKQ